MSVQIIVFCAIMLLLIDINTEVDIDGVFVFKLLIASCNKEIGSFNVYLLLIAAMCGQCRANICKFLSPAIMCAARPQ